MPRRTDIEKSPSPPSGGEGRGEGAVRIAAELDQYGSNHAVEIAQNIAIGETDHTIAPFNERGGPSGVVGFALGMGIAVKLDDQSFGSRREVRDVGRKNDLALKFYPEAVGADNMPQHSLRRSEVAAKLLGALSGFGVPFQRPPSPCLSKAQAFPLPLKGARVVRHLSSQFHESLSVNA